ncbi:hypothetical protein ACFC09_01660 [Streptomyces sp. NPDC056161]|uniref:hypothetical protein n=1 Tax=Streptomyces sp. NPDC056161 TaxID=3345732 RepID=UPI0035DD7BF7
MAGLSYRERTDAALWSDVPETVLHVAVDAFRASSGDLLMVWGEMVQYLGRQPAEVRARLLATIPAVYEKVPVGSALQLGLLHLGVVLGEGLSADTMVAERIEAVAMMEDRWCVQHPALLHLARCELAAGRTLSPAVIATVRRTAQLIGDPGWAALAARLTDPVLNAGEQWADAALADVLVSGPAWYALLSHAATARAAKPTAKWRRTGCELITGVGEAAVRERVLSWLSPAGRGRSRPLVEKATDVWVAVNEQFDPFNANALRGLIWLLSFLPPDEDTVLALGSLVDTCLDVVPGHGPRNAKVANAAVNALARLGDRTAVDELRRLAERTQYRNTLRLIDAALASHSG